MGRGETRKRIRVDPKWLPPIPKLHTAVPPEGVNAAAWAQVARLPAARRPLAEAGLYQLARHQWPTDLDVKLLPDQFASLPDVVRIGLTWLWEAAIRSGVRSHPVPDLTPTVADRPPNVDTWAWEFTRLLARPSPARSALRALAARGLQTDLDGGIAPESFAGLESEHRTALRALWRKARELGVRQRPIPVLRKSRA